MFKDAAINIGWMDVASMCYFKQDLSYFSVNTLKLFEIMKYLPLILNTNRSLKDK